MGVLLDFVLPGRCAVCGAGETALCEACRSSFRRIRPPLCARCGAPTAWPVERCSECAGRRLAFRTARAAVFYEGSAKVLVTAWKERGLRRLAGTLGDLVTEIVDRPTAGTIAFVPGDPDRTLWRGQNAAEALAWALAVRWEVPVRPLLSRVRRVPSQRGLPRSERRVNVRGSFRAEAVRGRVLLVDDVYTTGATVTVAGSELRRAGARSVDVVTFARAVRR